MSIKAFIILLGLFFFSPKGILAHEAEGISYPSLQFTSGSVRAEIADDKHEKIAIFKDKVHFKFWGVAEFFSDKISVGFSKHKKIKYFDLDGNVTMQKGALRISGKNAYTDNLHDHIDFMGMVVISTNGVDIHSMNIRYDFFKNTFFAF